MKVITGMNLIKFLYYLWLEILNFLNIFFFKKIQFFFVISNTLCFNTFFKIIVKSDNVASNFKENDVFC